MFASARYTSESSHTCVQLGRLYTRVLCSGILCLRNFQRDQNRKIIHLFGKGSSKISKIKRFLFSERLNVDTGFNGSRTSFFAKAKSSWVSIIDGVENVIKKREREKVLDISNDSFLHFLLRKLLRIRSFVAFDRSFHVAIRSIQFLARCEKSIISILIDDVFKNYDPLNETSEIGLLIPTSGRFFTSSTIKCHARAKWSTKELTRQRRGRSCRSKENKNKTFPLEKKEHTVERGKFANYAHLSLIILYFLLPSLLPYNNKHTFAEFPVSVLRRHGG